MTSTATMYADQAATPADLLAQVRANRTAADTAEAAILQLAVAWAAAHPAVPGDDTWKVTTRHATNCLEDSGHATEEELEGYGIPEVHWAAPAAFAAANGMSTATGKYLLRDALVLSHRLPAIYARVVAGQVPAWRARRVAQAVLGAPADVVAHIDTTIAPVADKVGPVTLTRAIDEAMLQLHAEEVEIAQAEAAACRHVTIDDRSVTANHGIGDLYGRGDWKDLRDFDQALSAIAHKLKATAAGEHESFDTLRSMALGVLADPAQALALLNGDDGPAPTKELVLFVHLTDAAIAGTDAVGRNETTGDPVLVQQIRDWCSRTDTRVTVKPVIDLNVDETVEAYAVPDRIRERVILRHPTCVFPWCTRPARGCDLDHVIPHNRGGPTADHNLAPLCRHHHRLKTHAGWRYTKVAPDHFLWSDPHQQTFLRYRDGSIKLTPP
jgi:hypothetical protein